MGEDRRLGREIEPNSSHSAPGRGGGASPSGSTARIVRAPIGHLRGSAGKHRPDRVCDGSGHLP